MKWLTLKEIKAQCRIDQNFTDEDDLLKRYGRSAESVILNMCGRSYGNIMETYGEIPDDLVLASLMLVAQSYQYRESVSPQNISVIPYTIDALVKPYVKL